MKWRFLCILCGLLVFGAMHAQEEMNLIPRAELFKEKTIKDVRISKDGAYIFYQKPGADGLIYYLHADKPTYERELVYDGFVQSWATTHDGGIVAVVREDTLQRVFYTSMRTRKHEDITPFPFKSLEIVAQSAKFPNKVAVRLEAKENPKTGYYLLDLASGRTKRLGRYDDFDKIWFNDMFMAKAAVASNDLGGKTIYRNADGQWFEVFEYPFDPGMFLGGLQNVISVSNDGKTIYATDNWEKDKTSLVAIDVATGEVTEVVADEKADILPFAATIDVTTGEPAAVVALWGDTRRHVINPDFKSDFDFLDKELDGNTGYVNMSADGNLWIVRKLDGGPIHYYLYDRKAKKLTELFNDFPYLDHYELAKRTTFTVKTRDGMELPVQVYLPPGLDYDGNGIPSIPLPTVIYVHGGPWVGVVQWNQWFHTRNFQLLANRGYAVINMEFRGSTGMGKAMTDAGDLQWGENMHHDILDVANWAVQNSIAYKGRIGLWGWSYGGYATNYALGKSPDAFKCGISMYGPADLYKFSTIDFTNTNIWRQRVGDPNTEDGKALLQKFSATNYVEAIQSPLLLTTGSKDERVPQSQIDEFAKALNDAGKEVVYFYYPEEGHDYRAPESWISFWAIAEQFLEKHLGGRSEPRGEDVEKGNFKVIYGADFISNLK
ncbi:MAG: S9 family peptidase [Bacteroidetes bacterium]|nr:MAG: S9 family peptidase [Bacteroidota bacterium]